MSKQVAVSRPRDHNRKKSTQALKAISWESEVLTKASMGYGSLDEEDRVIRYAAMRIACVFARNTASIAGDRETEVEGYAR